MNTRPEWVQDAVFYQIMPDRFMNGDPANDPPGVRAWGRRPTRRSFFGGDLDGVRLRLPYLRDLGVNALYLTPIFTAPSNHKYDTADYCQVDPALGGNGALRALVEDVHGAGMRIILDGVFNHTGDRFWAFRDVVERGEESRYRDWYSFQTPDVRRQPPNYRACGGVAYLPRLNTDNPAVRAYLYQVACQWITDFDIDGWRLDVPWEVSHGFWRGFRQAVKAVRPQAYLVGEAWGNAAPWLVDDQFDGVTHYPLRELLLRFVVQQAIDAGTFDRELAGLRGAYAPHVRRSMLTLLSSHDTARIRTVAGGRAGPVHAALAFLFTYEGAPMVYYGDEVGLEGGPDPDCRRCMPWEETAWHQETRRLVAQLCSIRQAHPALRRGSFRSLLCRDRTYAYARWLDGDVVAVAINAGFQHETVAVPPPRPAEEWRDQLTGEVVRRQAWGLSLALPPLGFRILAPA